MKQNRDNKNRILNKGERQKSDGRYEYRYYDGNGKRHSVYSWKLVETDKLPKGKKDSLSLREQEKQIQRDLDDGVNSTKAKRITLDDYFEEHLETRNVKNSTRVNYRYMYEHFVQGVLGNKKLSSIKYSDIRKLYSDLLKRGLKPNTIETIQTVLHPIFDTGVKDGIIRMNPTSGMIGEIKRNTDWSQPKRKSLTIPQQKAFINFIESSPDLKQWINVFMIYLGTGMRGGEVAGLRWDDCDFENNIIHVQRQVIYRKDESINHSRHMISTPKTDAGTRDIPMFKDVKNALLNERERQQYIGFNESVVDGVSGFVFRNREGNCLIPHDLDRAIDRIIDKYNASIAGTGKESLPHFSVHQLRHTFCTRMCENETNLKVIQEIMGHADITTTMDVYNEATMDKKKESFANLEGKVLIK